MFAPHVLAALIAAPLILTTVTVMRRDFVRNRREERVNRNV